LQVYLNFNTIIHRQHAPLLGPPVVERSWTSHRGRRRTPASGVEPEQRNEQGAAYVYTVPPSSSNRRRLHHRPAVSTVAPFPLASFSFLVPACERAIEPPRAGSSSFPHERPSNPAASVEASHCSNPMSRCRAFHACTDALCLCFIGLRATP
jgi:hypothetical protein